MALIRHDSMFHLLAIRRWTYTAHNIPGHIWHIDTMAHLWAIAIAHPWAIVVIGHSSAFAAGTYMAHHSSGTYMGIWHFPYMGNCPNVP